MNISVGSQYSHFSNIPYPMRYLHPPIFYHIPTISVLIFNPYHDGSVSDLKKGTAILHQDGDIMTDQIRAIDNSRLMKKVGKLPEDLIDLVKENILITLDLE